MDFSQLTWNPLLSRHTCSPDDDAGDWLGGEAWVTPQPFAVECLAAFEAPRAEDPGNDWIPL
ncbi:hypothetical protein [Dokdonella sp.]|uniref:hypothetical protein n=1 Tax=Dokdonella sp. TaxID=2291710 RepID=UPI0031BE540F|nr:hypothetical protein [Xanthomonadales bacterium]